jgi:hypothetical protein
MTLGRSQPWGGPTCCGAERLQAALFRPPCEPAVTMARLNVLVQVLRSAGAGVSPADPGTDGHEGQP